MGKSATCVVPLVRFFCWAALVCSAAAEGNGPMLCGPNTTFQQIRDESFGKLGQTSTVSVTRFLPAGETAQFVFRQPLGNGTSSTVFRIFQIKGDNIAKATGVELPILSVQSAPDGLVDGYNSSNSVVLRFRVSSRDSSFWEERDFVVAACSGGQFVGWGLAAARVSDPLVAFAVCSAIALLTYLLAMIAVWASRRTPHALATKYPAFFSAPKMRVRDFINPIHLTANAFNQGSVQKLQVLLFSFLVGWLLLSLVLRTGELANLSPTIVGLLGISGIGAATAQITYQQKTRLSFENWAWLEKRAVIIRPDTQSSPGPRWRDLVLTNREFDVYKLQTIIFSASIVFALISTGGSNLSSFTVPDALLGILGLSQVVYIGGILVRPPAIDDLDQALTKLRAAGEMLSVSEVRNIDTGPDGKLLDQLPAGQPVAANARRQYSELADRVEVMIESALEVQVDRTKL